MTNELRLIAHKIYKGNLVPFSRSWWIILSGKLPWVCSCSIIYACPLFRWINLECRIWCHFGSCSITTIQDSAAFKAIPKNVQEKFPSERIQSLFNGSYCLLAGLSNKGYKSKFDNLFLNLRNLFLHKSRIRSSLWSFWGAIDREALEPLYP